MNKLIHSPAFDIFIDKENDRFFLVGRRVNVFDASTNKKLAALSDIPYKNHVRVSNKNGIIAVSSTVGHFAFYSSTDYSLLGTLKIRTNGNTDDAFYYDEDENAIYGICYARKNKHAYCFLYRVSPETMSYITYNLPTSLDPPNEPDFPIRYCFHKHVGDDFFLRRNNCDENIYGRYRIENGVMVLKETIFVRGREVYTYDIEVPELGEDICEFINLQQYLPNGLNFYNNAFFRNERGIFLTFNGGVAMLKPDGEFEIIYKVENPHGMYTPPVTEYAEYNGRQYICTWNYCLVRNIEE